MVQTKNSHIIKVSKNLVDRLQTIKLEPDYILSDGVDIALIEAVYPGIGFVKNERADLILGVVEFSSGRELAGLLTLWRKRIKPDGVLLFGFIDFEVDIQEIGDFLLWLGFVNVVVDCEENVIYGHACGPLENSIKVSQIRRVS